MVQNLYIYLFHGAVKQLGVRHWLNTETPPSLTHTKIFHSPQKVPTQKKLVTTNGFNHIWFDQDKYGFTHPS